MKIKELTKNNLGYNVEIEALLESLEDKVAKNNVPYVKGFISDMGKSLEFRIWETNLETLKKNLELIPGKIIKLEGEFQTYQNVNCLSVKDTRNIQILEENPDNYIFSAPEPEKMYKTIFSLVEKFEDEAIKKIAEDYLVTNKEALLVSPFSEKLHSEKGGLIYHIFQVVSQIRKNVVPRIKGFDLRPLNLELMYTAAILTHASIIALNKVNLVTGVIEESDDKIKKMYDKFADALVIQKLFTSEDYNSEVVEKLIHLCLTATTSTAPVTPEAVLFSSYDKAELNFYSMMEATAFASEDVEFTKTKDGKFVIV